MTKMHWTDDILLPKNRSIYAKNRTALDSFGRLGSLFDAYRDEVINTVVISDYKKSSGYPDIRRCQILCDSKDLNENIYKMVQIDDATRLSLLLNLRENAGISRIIQCDIPMKENIRLFWYTHIERTEKLSHGREHIKYTDTQTKSLQKGTHIITSVEWGIDVAIVLQLPNDADTMKEIDSVLEDVRMLLLTNQGISSLEPTGQAILKEIMNTKVYSNIYEINFKSTLFDVFTYMEKEKNNINNRPVSYKIRPITWLFPQYASDSNKFVSPPTELLNSVEQYIIQLSTHMKQLITFAERELPQRLAGKLPKVFRSVQKMCLNVKLQCENEIERFIRLILAVRRDQIELSEITMALKDEESMTMKRTIRNLDRSIHDLERKALFIHELNEQNFRYINVSDYGIKRTHNSKMIEIKLIEDNQYDRILCSNDVLKKVRHRQFNNLRDYLIKERENNSDLRLIYADFSYCSYKLKTMKLLPRSIFDTAINKLKQTGMQDSIIGTQTCNNMLPKNNICADASGKTNHVALKPVRVPINITRAKTRVLTSLKSEDSSPSTMRKLVFTSPPKAKDHLQLPPIGNLEDKAVNILLIGETGVGKSTFINALANYLTFNTMEEAENNPPVVLIPGSFLVTSKTEKQIVKFGDINDDEIQYHEHRGRTITERCRSYEFDFEDINALKVRFIDTPGFGDVRGLRHDDHHMQHIMQYIKQYTQLNTICFILNVDDIRLNIFLRSCLTQLFTFLGPDVRSRITFCFTGCRSTFYGPGKTHAILKKILMSFAFVNIPLTKANTFYYDNEPFRYLVGLQNGINFSDLEKKDCEISWSKSVVETKRFLQYVCSKHT